MKKVQWSIPGVYFSTIKVFWIKSHSRSRSRPRILRSLLYSYRSTVRLKSKLPVTSRFLSDENRVERYAILISHKERINPIPALPTWFCTFTPPRNFQATRDEISSAGKPTRSTNNLRGITMGWGPIWGINSPRFILSYTSTISIRFNLLSVYPSVPPFVFARIFILSLNILSGYSYVSFNLVAIPTAWILINFLTQPL